jgi:anti-sigma-K factor RskA
VGLWAADLSLELDDTRAALERERAAAAVLADPGARSTALQEGEGRLIVAEDSRAVLVLDALEPAPSGKTYQVWIVDQGEAPAGLFPGSEGVEIVQVEGTVEPGEVVAVTIEDAGGAEAPSSEPIVGSMPV